MRGFVIACLVMSLFFGLVEIAGALPLLSIRSGLTQSAGTTYIGMGLVFFGMLGASYDRALVSSPYNLGVLAVFVGYQTYGSGVFGSLGLIIPPQNMMYQEVFKSSPARLFVEAGWNQRFYEGGEFAIGASLGLKYYFNNIYRFSPAGLSPSVGVTLHLGRV